MVVDGERPETSGLNTTPSKAPHDGSSLERRSLSASVDASSTGQFVLTQHHVTLFLIERLRKQPITSKKLTRSHIHLKEVTIGIL